MLKKYIDKIVENGNNEQMEELSDMLVDAIHKLKMYDEDCYDDYKEELYIMAYGKNLTEEKARKIIENMKPYGMHWTLEQTNQVKAQHGLNDIRDIDFWVVLNSAYNDFHNLFEENLDYYVRYAKDFIMDEDAEKGKVYTYYTHIPKRS